MDTKNRFDGRTTYQLIRLEYAIGLLFSIAVAVIHIKSIRWIPFIGLFAYIDVIGYIPGAIAYRRSGDGRISRIYYLLYNTTHSMAFNAAVAGLWVLLIGPEWSLLALPIHLCGDRGLFGNYLKPFSVPFEPHVIPAFTRFEDEIGRGLESARRLPRAAVAPASHDIGKAEGAAAS